MLKNLFKKMAGPPSNTIFWLCLAYYLLMACITPGFFTVNNTWNLLYSFLPLLIIAIGQTFVMLTAGIDLSITSIVAVASVAGGYMMSTDTTLFASPALSILSGIILMLLVGAIIGSLNGIAVARLRMPAFMVTLTSLLFFSGLAVWLTKSQNIYKLPPAFVEFPYRSFLGLPLPIYLGLLVVALTYLLLNRTLLGEWIYAVGVSTRTALISGVKINRTIVLVYMISGLCAAVGSILYTARLETGSPVMGQNILLDVIGAVVIGGTSLFGGRGRIQWTIAGALLMTMLDNSLNLLGLSFFLIMIVKGAIILITALINVLNENKEASHA